MTDLIEKPIKPVFEDQPLIYPIICIPAMDDQGKRTLAVGFGIVPREREYRDHSQLSRHGLNMLAIAIGGTGMFGGRVPISTTPRGPFGSSRATGRNPPQPEGNRHGRIRGWANVPPRQGIAGAPPTASPAEPNLTPKGRKERQKLLEQKLAKRKKAKA